MKMIQIGTLQLPKAKTVGIQMISDTGSNVPKDFTVNNKRPHPALAAIISVRSMTNKQILATKVIFVRPGMNQLEHIIQTVLKASFVKHRPTWYQPLAAI
jgi:hypothetical protein